MQLTKSSKTFNLGDTSFRRKILIDDYKTLLPYLMETNDKFESWNKKSQADFYSRVLSKSDLFSRNNTEDFAKRGRTLTSALVKIGLVNDKRELSEVSRNWINNKLKSADKIERLLGIDLNNILFLRQLLKLRVYSHDGKNFFYPFRVALRLLSEYKNVPQVDFLTLIHLIKPETKNSKVESIISDYAEVSNNNKVFAEFVEEKFPDKIIDYDINDLFSGESIDEEKFNEIFVNRKSSNTQGLYYKFVTDLLKFKNEPDDSNLSNLLDYVSNDKIKKAFAFGKSVFNKKSNVEEFLEANEDNLLLSDDNIDIYRQFVLSKKEYIVDEYRDMTKRTFNLTGIIDFSNGLVNVTNQQLIKEIFYNIKISGEDLYENYESNLTFSFYRDINTEEILSISEDDLLSKIKKIFDSTDITDLEDTVINKREMDFRKFIKKEFPKKKIISLLPLFSVRDDVEIKKQVSESATVPTIYEYIMAIAWYYISDAKFYITKSMNLTLDGNMLPLSHAAGGAGDIVIDYDNLTLMLEVTLMNSQAQKRGEWEPVLRHATNLTIEKSPKNVITLFIANEMDENTINIWRAIAGVPLKDSNMDAYTDLVKIFPLMNEEVIFLLENKQNDFKLLQSINDSYNKINNNFNLGWRQEILEKLNFK
ncbi:AlwI family type II restriction endonuclease [Companilactobacillus baiquanensis]|uniref:AlwI family type II restriction endonuclease n=1 Tax=Companilactobacillus baiquanensis TaxID=2486005 RepID=A0ABW1UZ55_9LACO|nr:AlwI family type II restriction endonuclease [Companilactobacillus baiquanensis]